IRVALSIGDYDSADSHLGAYHLIITTYEKADSLLRHHAPWLGDVGHVVVDEIHYIDDAKRGPVLEMLLAILRDKLPGRQFLALSATIGNVEEIASWLDADYVYDEWRPVPLREAVYKSGRLYFSDGEARRVRDEGGAVPSLVLDTLREGGQALVFASSRRRAVSLARALAEKTRSHVDRDTARSYAEKLARASESRELASTLGSLVSSGVSFHHAGLGYSERRIIEEAFRKGAIKAIVATPTLGAGVNLPARRVILDSYTRYEAGLGRVPIKAMEYKQFAGRAGRPGYDEYGEAVLIASPRDDVEELMEQYIFSGPEPIWSKLGTQAALRSHVLASIASHGADTRDKILGILSKTLYASQY
ncbi:MAG: helicase-related protein, partial [Candidatus Korarchaeota archaeon]|nr:helicase-related protein [Candidatus Korarchaeota archaeon]